MRKEFWLALALATGIFLVHGSHRQEVGANQAARIFGAFTFLEPGPDQGTFQIDVITKPGNIRGIGTGDWSRSGDHFFSNKAPGSTALALPALWVARAWDQLQGQDPNATSRLPFQAHLVNILVTTLLLALAAVILFLARVREGWGPFDAILPPVVLAFGTLLFPYGTSFWGHPLAAALVMISLLSSRSSVAGFFSALAVSIEYLAGLSLITGFLWRLLFKSRPQAAWFVAGAVLPMLFLGGLQWWIFGSPFISAFQNTNPQYMDGSILNAFQHFDGERLWLLTGSPYRGLFFFSPVLAIPLLFRTKFDGKQQLFHGANFVLYLFTVAAFNGWHGGWATGPRYLLVAVPYLILALPRWTSCGRIQKLAYATSGALSLTIAWLVAVTGITAPQQYKNPLIELLIPALKNSGHKITFLAFESNRNVAVWISAVLMAATVAGILALAWRAQKFSEKS